MAKRPDPFAEGFDFTSGDRRSDAAFGGPHVWDNHPPIRYASSKRNVADNPTYHARRALETGYINEYEYDWITSVTDQKDQRTTAEKILMYKDHTGGALGRLDDIFGFLETISGYRALVSVSAAVTEGLLQKGGGGFAFSTEEFKRAWRARTSYRDVLMKGGDTLFKSRGNIERGAGAFVTTLMFDIMLDPATYLTFGIGSGTKIAIRGEGRAAKLLREASGDIPSTLTLSRWGDDVYQVATRELIGNKSSQNKAGEIARRILSEDSKFVRGGLDTLAPTDLTRLSANGAWRTAVGEYMVVNYDRLAAKAVGYSEEIAQKSGKGEILTARVNAARGPGALFEEYAGIATGYFRKGRMVARGGARDMFQETADFLHKDRGLRTLGRASVVSQVAGSLIDPSLMLSAAGTALLTEVPALAIKGIGKALPGSWNSALKETFQSAVERLPTDDAMEFERIRGSMGVALDGKRGELVDFFASKVVSYDNAAGKHIARQLTRDEREIIARHLDNPELELIDEQSPLASAAKWAEDQFDLIWQQEHELGITGDKWEDYVTHFYGSRSAGEVAKYFRASSRRDTLIARLDHDVISNRNRFALHRMIATFEEAEAIFGKGAVDTDIASILAKRWSSSLKMQSKYRAMEHALRKHGVPVIGELFRSAHAHIGRLGGKAGNITRGFVDTGPVVKASLSDIDAFVAELGQAAKLKRGAQKLSPAEKGPQEAFADADWFVPVTDKMDDAAKASAFKRNKELFGKVAKDAHRRPLRDLTQGEFEALRDFMRIAVPKRRTHLETAVRISGMSNVHDMRLVEIGAGAGAVRVIRNAHTLDRAGADVLTDYSQDELVEIGRGLAKARGIFDEIRTRFPTSEKTAGADPNAIAIAMKSARAAVARDREFARIAREDILKRSQRPGDVRGAVESGLVVGEQRAIELAKHLARKAGAQLRKIPKDLRDMVMEAHELPAKLDEAKMALGKAIAEHNKSLLPDQLIISKAKESTLENTILLRHLEARILQQGVSLRRSLEADEVRDISSAGIHIIKSGVSSKRHKATKLARAAVVMRILELRKDIHINKQSIDDLTRKLTEPTDLSPKEARARDAGLRKNIVELRDMNESKVRELAKIDPDKASWDLLMGKIETVRKIQDKNVKDIYNAEARLRTLANDPILKDLRDDVSNLVNRRDELMAVLKNETVEAYAKRLSLLGQSAAALKSAERLAQSLDVEKRLWKSTDRAIAGQWYLPKAWVSAIDEAFGSTFNPSDRIDRFLAAWQKVQLLWKIPLTLPFFEHHGRNAITNAFLTSGHVGLRMLNPKNWYDVAKVVAYMGSRAGHLEKGVIADATRTVKRIEGLKEPDLRGVLDDATMTSVDGRVHEVKEVVRQILLRGTTHAFTHADVDEVVGVFGGLFRGHMIPNTGLMRSWGRQSIERIAASARKEGAIGGTALGVAKEATSALKSAAANTLAASRKVVRATEYAVDVPFRVAIFVDAVKRGKSYDEAAEEVRRHLNDWSRLSVREKKYLRSAIPFYSWIQFSMERFLKDLTTNPKAITNPIRAIRNFGDAMMAEPPSPDYSADWLSDRIGFWGEEGEELKTRYVLNGLNADEAFRQVLALQDLTSAMGHRLSKMVGADAMAWTVFRPDGNPKDDLRMLSQIDFVAGTVFEAAYGRELFTGAPTGIRAEVIQADGWSRLEAAEHLVHPSTRESVGATWLRSMFGVEESPDGDPRKARAVAWRRWIFGRTPIARFISEYERKRKSIVAAYKAGDPDAAHSVAGVSALEFLGVRAYAYDTERSKLYYNRDRISAVTNLLLQAGYLETFRIPYPPKKR